MNLLYTYLLIGLFFSTITIGLGTLLLGGLHDDEVPSLSTVRGTICLFLLGIVIWPIGLVVGISAGLKEFKK